MTWIVDHGAGAAPRFTEHADQPGTKGVNAGVRFAATPRYGEPGEGWDWTAKAWVSSVAWTEAHLLGSIDVERCHQLSAAATDGAMINCMYAIKRAEVLHYDTLTSAILAALSIADRRRRFTFLLAEADARGETLAQVVDRVRERFTAMAPIEAKAVAAKERIRAAATVAAKRAAADSAWGNT